MANLNDLNLEDNTIVLAHCTVSTQLCKKRILRSHFESRIGVAIQGKLPLQKKQCPDPFGAHVIKARGIEHNNDRLSAYAQTQYASRAFEVETPRGYQERISPSSAKLT